MGRQVIDSREQENTLHRRSGTVSIETGESASDAYEHEYASNVAIAVPDELKGNSIAFQVQGHPGGAWFDLYSQTGTKIVLTAGDADRAFHVAELAGWWAFKVVGETTGSPEQQDVDMDIVVQSWDV